MGEAYLPIPILQVIWRAALEEGDCSLLILSLSELCKTRGNIDLQLVLVSLSRWSRSSLLVCELGT